MPSRLELGQAPPLSGGQESISRVAPNVQISNIPSNQAVPPHTSHHDPTMQPILSERRWLVLVAMSTFGLAMTVAGDTAPVFNPLLKLLDLRVDEYMYIGQLFHNLMILLIAPTAIFVDRFGIKASIKAAAGFFALQGIFKALLYYDDLAGWSEYKMYYYLASCLFGTQSFALFLLLPLKVSETWFSVKERSVAWTLMMIQFDVGICIAGFCYPRLIETTQDFKLLSYINLAAVAITGITCLLCVAKSEPDNPPSERMAEATKDIRTPIWVAFKKIIRHQDLMLHIVHSGIFTSMGLTTASVLQNIMTSNGRTEVFAGDYMSVNSLVSIFMMITMASFLHKVSNATMACKLGSLAQSILFIASLLSFYLVAPSWLLIAVSILLTVCKSWSSPHFNNMTAQLACGTVSQATIVGLSVIVAALIMTCIQMTFAYLIVKIDDKHNDYQHPFIFLITTCVVNELIYLAFFKGRQAKELQSSANSGNLRGIDNGAFEGSGEHTCQ